MQTLKMDAAPAPSPLRAKRLAVVVGGTLSDDARRAVREGRRPRIDVLEMESRWGARVHDFSRLRQPPAGRGAVAARWLARRAGLWSPGLAYDVLSAVRDDDVVYATGEDVGYPLALLMRAFRVRGPRLVVRLDQPVLGRTPARRTVADAYIHAALKRMDWIGCHSNVQRQYLASVSGVPEGRLGLLPPKVDAAFFSPNAAPEPAAREVVPAAPYVVSAGLEMRDYETLIEAVRGLPVMLVIGAASPWSHFRFDRSRPLPDNVRVGSFSPAQMRELYRSALFTVVPVKPTLRTCGITVVLESWAMEKGVVASRTVGLLDYAVDGESALLTEPGDAGELRAAVTRLLERPDEAERLGHAGRARVDERFGLDGFMAGLERALTAVAGG